MGIGVLKGLFSQECTKLFKQLDDIRICIKNILSYPLSDAHFRSKSSVVIYRREKWESMPQTELIIVLAMTRRDMNASGPRLERDKIRSQDFVVPIKKRVVVGGSLQFTSEQLLDWGSICCQAGSFGECRDQLFC